MDFKESLAATLAKSQEDRRIFDLVFDRFFFRAAEMAAVREGVTEGGGMDAAGAELNLETLRQQIAQALRDGQEALMRDLARLAIAAFGRQGEGSGVIGVDVQRIRRALGLRAEPQPDLPPDDPRAEGLPRDAIRRFEALLRQELERRQIERTETLPPARPLNELDRALPSGPLQDLAAVHRVVAQLKRRLKTQGHELRGRKRHAQVDVRKTMRASLETGGVPVVLRYKPIRPRRPEIYVLCDVSTSVTSASVFFLSVLHALHDSFRKMRSFVFIERISEVTDVFERERNFKAVSEAIGRDAGVADVSGYTDYGRVWSEFATLVEDDLHPRATVIVLGDARTNGRDPRADVFAQVADKAGRTFWLNPEPRLYWNYGDSVIAAYERHCEAFECWTTGQLEDFVKALTRPVGRSLRRRQCRRWLKRSPHRGLDQALRRDARPRRARPRGAAPARCTATSAPTAPARRRRSASCSGCTGRRAGAPSSSASTPGATRCRAHRRVAYVAGEPYLWPSLTGAETFAFLARVRGAHRRRLPRRAGRALPARHRQEGARAVEGQPPEGAARRGVRQPGRPADPRRAHERPRPADGGRLPRDGARGHASAARPSSCPRTSSARSRRSATASASCATAASSRRGRCPSCAT